MTAAVVAEYLDALGYPPDAATWPDDDFYPIVTPPAVYAFLIAHAREQPGRKLPARWAKHRHHEPHSCYTAAGAIALRNRHVRYTEGVAFDGDHAQHPERPVPHAWLSDSAGGVVDLSVWTTAIVYFGIPIPTRLYAECVAHDKIARPILPALIGRGWTPAPRKA